MTTSRRGFGKIVAASALTALVGFASVPAQAAVDFSGKTVTWIIPFKEGGGSDKWSRFYAPLLSRPCPASPPWW